MGRTFQITSIFRRLTALENVQTAFLSHHRRHYNIVVAGPAALPGRRAGPARARGPCASRRPSRAGSSLTATSGGWSWPSRWPSAPQLLLLDEPTAGMAPRERHEIMALVARIAADTGLTVVFTEHDMDVVFAVARRITVLHQGAVLAEGAPRRGPRQRRRAARVPRAAEGALMALLELSHVDTYYDDSHILFDLSLDVEAGEVVCLLGRNGAGKTTTVRSIVGLTPPRGGPHHAARPRPGRAAAVPHRPAGHRLRARGPARVLQPHRAREPGGGAADLGQRRRQPLDGRARLRAVPHPARAAPAGAAAPSAAASSRCSPSRAR